MNSSLFWCIAGIIGGALVSLFFYFISLKRKSLIYKITTTTVISDATSHLENLKIKYNKKKITTLYSSTIEFQNTGNCIIEKSDFVPSKPLAITTNGEFIVNKNGKINQDVDINNIYLIPDDTHIDSLKRALMSYEYIPKKTSITLMIFHTEPIQISGKLKDGKMHPKDNLSLHISIVSGLIGMIATILGVLMGNIATTQKLNSQIHELMHDYQTNNETTITTDDLQQIIDEYNKLQNIINDYEKDSN